MSAETSEARSAGAEELPALLRGVEVVLLVAAEVEAAPMRDGLSVRDRLRVAGKDWTWGTVETVRRPVSVALLVTGCDKANAAHALTCLLQAHRPRLVLQSGVGGGFARAGVGIGDLVVATSEAYGDTGSSTPGGWMGMDCLGLPLVEDGARVCFNEFPLDPGLVAAVVEVLVEGAGSPDPPPATEASQVVPGPFLTLSRVTGTDGEAAELEHRWHPVAESMEGAAAAQVCALYGVPFLEVRGVSNLVGDRDREAWDLPGAAARAAAAVLRLCERLEDLPMPPPSVPPGPGIGAGRRLLDRDDHADHGVTEEPLLLAFSPCPNDTFIFHAWVSGHVPGAPPVTPRLDDIDMLNTLALEGRPDVAKISFHAFGHLRERYALLHSGGALGRGCGPLLVARADSDLIEGAGLSAGGDLAAGALEADRYRPAPALAGVRIAIPGPLTTAALLLRLFAPQAKELVTLPYDRIMPAVAGGEVEAGLIIHESRFTYPEHGLALLVDLGAWWEETTGHPIPLGCIVVRRDLGKETAIAVDAAVRASLVAARRDPAASRAYVRRHAQELEQSVCEAHIELYVTDFSLDYGREGEAAIRHLLATAESLAIIPASSRPLFWDEE